MNASEALLSLSSPSRRRPQLDPLRVIGVVRVSTEDQSLSVAAQRKAMQTWCRTHDAELVEVFSDVGVSGGAPLDERLGLMAAIDAVTKLKAGTVLVLRRDRLARDAVSAGIAQRLIERQGGVVRSCDGMTDAQGPEGALLRAVLDALAEYERLLIRARTKSALSVKRERGERIGSVPWGMALAKDGVHLVVNRKEAEAVAIAHRLHRRKRSLRDIAATLDKRGFRSRAGGRLWPASIQGMLRAALPV